MQKPKRDGCVTNSTFWDKIMSEFVTCTTQKWIFENILVFKLLISMMTALAAQGMTVICLFVMVMWSPAPVNKGRA